MAICNLCESKPSIKSSHVIPAFVFRAIKSDSTTGFMRRPAEPNKRMQDGDKQPILCEECEQRFSRRELQFNNHIFRKFHQEDKDDFPYGDWLHYFLTSLSWRTLRLDLEDSSTTDRMPTQVLTELQDFEGIMRRYLLGEKGLSSAIRNHIFFFLAGDIVSSELAAAGPNFLIRRSVGGYTLWTADGHSAVIHNLAGMLCVTHVRGNPKDVWKNTKVSPNGGMMVSPQKVYSWIAHDFFEAIIDFSSSNDRMSVKQRGIVEAAASQNPHAASLRFRELDSKLLL